jgi:hypothetical protein
MRQADVLRCAVFCIPIVLLELVACTTAGEQALFTTPVPRDETVSVPAGATATLAQDVATAATAYPPPLVPIATARPDAAAYPPPSVPTAAAAYPVPASGTPSATEAVQPPSEELDSACCTLAEGAFANILRNHPDYRRELGCPSSGHPRIRSQAWDVQTAYQPFEHGTMVWSSQMGWLARPVIFVLFENGSFQDFQDEYDPAVDPVDGGETAPTGLVQPKLGFGKVWREEPGVRDALGWAVAEETPGPGRYQTFLGGDMIWLSQRAESYIMFRNLGRYATQDTRIFVETAPTPSVIDPAFLAGRWQPAAPHAEDEFAIGADGTIAFDGCAGRYRLDANVLHVDSGACSAPVLRSGAYHVTVGATEDTLVLSQRFRHVASGYSTSRWRALDAVEDTEVDLGATTVSAAAGACRGTREPVGGCSFEVVWSECAATEPTFAPGTYDFVYQGDMLILRRSFERVGP